MDKVRSTKRDQLGRDDWVRGALAVIAADGFHALSVDGLAKRMRVTRGSFYWHFADRAALVRAALAHWEDQCTRQVIVGMEELPTPVLRLRALLAVAFIRSDVSDIEIKLAEGAGDPAIQESLARVTSLRLDTLARLFADLGFSAEEAAARARLTYATYLGYHRAASYAPAPVDTPADLEVLAHLLTARG